MCRKRFCRAKKLEDTAILASPSKKKRKGALASRGGRSLRRNRPVGKEGYPGVVLLASSHIARSVTFLSSSSDSDDSFFYESQGTFRKRERNRSQTTRTIFSREATR